MARATNHEAAREAAYELPKMDEYLYWAQDQLDFARQGVETLPLVLGPESPLAVVKTMMDAMLACWLAGWVPNQRQQVS